MEDRSSPLKLHRRHATLDGRDLTVLTLRPNTSERFATNFHHQTWHVLTDQAGAQLLGRLCWGLSYQRRPGTILVIDHPLLQPNPFDADPSSPIVIANSDLTALDRATVDRLKRFLSKGRPSDGTVRLSTGGLDRLLADDPQRELARLQQQSGVFWNEHQRRSWTDRINGMVVMAAPPPVLQWWAIWLSRLGTTWYRGTDWTELEHIVTRRRDGEVQIFEHFTRMTETAIATRERLFPDTLGRELLDDERRSIWAALPADHQQPAAVV